MLIGNDAFPQSLSTAVAEPVVLPEHGIAFSPLLQLPGGEIYGRKHCA